MPAAVVLSMWVGSAGPMRIELEQLEKSREVEQSYAPGQLSLGEPDLELFGPVDIRGVVRRRENEVEFRGRLHTRVRVACARCLKPVELPVDAEFAERFVPAVSWRSEEEHELKEADLNLAVFDGEGIELDDLVREEVLLAIPAQLFCREDCKGLCPVCGIDRNSEDCECESGQVDSRWEALKNLRF